jgi:hypothetical protein
MLKSFIECTARIVYGGELRRRDSEITYARDVQEKFLTSTELRI